MLREATGGLMSRPEGFVIALSTQSDEPPTGVFKDWLERFRKIRDGEIVSNRALGLLYEFPEHMIRLGGLQAAREFLRHQPEHGRIGR
jgi:phage terminase large subunit-like protein